MVSINIAFFKDLFQLGALAVLAAPKARILVDQPGIPYKGVIFRNQGMGEKNMSKWVSWEVK